MTTSPETLPDIGQLSNLVTIAAYEQCAEGYAQSTRPVDDPLTQPGFQELICRLSTGSRILEIGSGPGWDADALEAAGFPVARTDAAEAFVRIQMERGKSAQLLDVVRDPLGGPFAAIVAMYVFQHIEKERLSFVATKLAAALDPDGLMLFSIQEGEDEGDDRRSDGNSYLIARWSAQELHRLLVSRGFALLWLGRSVDSEGRWMIMLVRREG